MQNIYFDSLSLPYISDGPKLDKDPTIYEKVDSRSTLPEEPLPRLAFLEIVSLWTTLPTK